MYLCSSAVGLAEAEEEGEAEEVLLWSLVSESEPPLYESSPEQTQVHCRQREKDFL